MSGRALIVDPAYLGDVVFDGPLARALANDGYEVGIVVRPPFDALAKRMKHVTHVHVFDKRGKDSGWSGLSRVARAIAGGRYEVAYVPHPSVRSAMLASRAKIPERIGPKGNRLTGMWLTEKVDVPEGRSFVEDRLALFAKGGERSLDGVLERKTARPESEKPRVGVVLGSEWATKRWPSNRAGELTAEIGGHVRFVWIGAAWEKELYEGLGDGEDRTGGTIDDLIDAIESCDLVIGGDTGPTHVARGLGIPVVALFGPTSEARHDFAEVDRVVTEVMACRPCSAHGDKKCPLGHHECLVNMSGTRVGRVALDVLPPT